MLVPAARQWLAAHAAQACQASCSVAPVLILHSTWRGQCLLTVPQAQPLPCPPVLFWPAPAAAVTTSCTGRLPGLACAAATCRGGRPVGLATADRCDGQLAGIKQQLDDGAVLQCGQAAPGIQQAGRQLAALHQFQLDLRWDGLGGTTGAAEASSAA